MIQPVLRVAVGELVDGRFVPAVLNWYKFVSAAPREKRLPSTLLTRGMFSVIVISFNAANTIIAAVLSAYLIIWYPLVYLYTYNLMLVID